MLDPVTVRLFDGMADTFLLPIIFGSETTDVDLVGADGRFRATVDIRDAATGALKRTVVLEGSGGVDGGALAPGNVLERISLYDRDGDLAAVADGLSLTAEVVEELLSRAAFYEIRGAEFLTYVSIDDLYFIGPRQELPVDLAGSPVRDVVHYSGGPFLGRMGAGDDLVVLGSSGADTVLGGAGDDVIDGGSRPDDLRGGPGADWLQGARDDDRLRGDGGDDTLIGDGKGRFGGADLLRGGGGDDRLAGGLFADTLFGGDGDDELDGGPDGDTLSGGPGADTLAGGEGENVLYGGPGADVFRVDAATAGTHRIMDVEADLDRLEIVGSAAVSGIGDLAIRVDGEEAIVTAGEAQIVLVRESGSFSRSDLAVLPAPPETPAPPSEPVTVRFGSAAGPDVWAFERIFAEDGRTIERTAADGEVTVTVRLFDGETGLAKGTIVASGTGDLADGALTPDTSIDRVVQRDATGTAIVTVNGLAIDGAAAEESLAGIADPVAGLERPGAPEPFVAPLFVPVAPDLPTRPLQILGTDASNRLLGDDADDIARGRAGDDLLVGRDGNDTLFGGAGNDDVQGVDGNDLLFGGPGADFMSGQSDDDTLFGGSGNDTLGFFDSGDNVLRGQAGDDFIYVYGSESVVFGGPGADTFEFSSFGASGRVAEIRDFSPGEDLIRIAEREGLATFDDLSIETGGRGTRITVPDLTITLRGVTDPLTPDDVEVFTSS